MKITDEVKQGIIDTLQKGTFEKVSIKSDMIELEPEGDTRRFKAGDRLTVKVTLKREDN